MSSEVLLSEEGQIATVTLNRPERFNATTHNMWLEIKRIFDYLGENPDLRAIFLEGAGPHFSSGSEIREFLEALDNPEAARDFWLTINNATKAVEDCMHPVIAMVNGFALGASMDLANACCMRVGTTRSAWGVPAARVGVTYGQFATTRLKDLVGGSHASWILSRGEIFRATRATRIGLINELVRPEDLTATKDSLVDNYCVKSAPLAVRDQKRRNIIDRRHRIPADADDVLPLWAASQDLKEGLEAFLEKRSPKFRGI